MLHIVQIFFVVGKWVNIEKIILQCDQIERFLQVFGNKLSHKSSSNILGDFLVYFS